ncbi:MAG: TonB-dependent receptor [Runella slithyformis]|nr:MAG: TonB-dependent receptor [Runella slithyformis]TAF26345.1 MAG: TonB-dependent receptor [Runella slithyformis]TAF45186.1 MAG: TonB-dependent receptor [Runella slithyformis]TAF80418.1 MAG: TonB-dependent receptor [Runella slithyformis]
MKKIALLLTFTSSLLLTVTDSTFAQKKTGEIDSQTFEVEKKKRIELPPANRLYNKVQPAVSAEDNQKMSYEFNPPKLSLGAPKLTPAVLPVNGDQKKDEEAGNLNNYVKVGAGNFGKLYAETFLGGGSPDLSYNVQYKHLSNQTGPVDAKNSASSDNNLKLNGIYQTGNFKVSGGVHYDRENYYFYARRNAEKANIRQTLNTMGANLGFENSNNERLIDYGFQTSIYRLTDNYNASETDWATNFTGSVSILPNFYALVGAGAYVSQRADAETFARNLFRVTPSFKYVHSNFTITAAFKAINETDDRLQINRTVGFPVVELDVTPFSGVHLFAGLDGDINRNTLRSLLNENRWLAPNVTVANTEKNRDIYGGAKGELGSGFQFEVKVSYANYKNFYAFNNSWTDTTQFSVLYDADYINALAVSGQVGYQYKNIVRSTLRADVFDYNVKRLEAAWNRPTTTITWNNSFVFTKKLFATLDLYYLAGLQGKNFATNRIVKQENIADLNLKIDYLLTRNFSSFVSVNNLLGRSYERYLYYPQQGLNFLAGLSFQF